jgi:hypothetical protein
MARLTFPCEWNTLPRDQPGDKRRLQREPARFRSAENMGEDSDHQLTALRTQPLHLLDTNESLASYNTRSELDQRPQLPLFSAVGAADVPVARNLVQTTND